MDNVILYFIVAISSYGIQLPDHKVDGYREYDTQEECLERAQMLNNEVTAGHFEFVCFPRFKN